MKRDALQVVFDPDFVGDVWPGPLGSRQAAAGEVWLGEDGLLELLELHLGLGGPRPSEIERAAHLVPALAREEGFWSRSFTLSPLGVANEVLRLADELRMGGWTGTTTGAPRLDPLGRVLSEVPAGRAERLEAVTGTLVKRPAPDLDLRLLIDPATLPRRWRDLLAALDAAGARVRSVPLPPAPADGDLEAVRAPGFVPVGDGSLQLVRPPAAREAAEEIACWLATYPEPSSRVLIHTDPLLDTALRRHGLPTTGAQGSYHENVLLGALPLVLELAWDPPDPQVALDLLTLPMGPVTGKLRHRLARALHDAPAIGSPAWEAVLARDDHTDEQVTEARTLFTARVPRDPDLYPVPEALERIRCVLAWVDRRTEALSEASPIAAPWVQVRHQASLLASLLEATRLETLSRPELGRVLAHVAARVPRLPRHPAEAGLPCVAHPACVAGPVRQVVWWDFTRDSAGPLGRTFPLTPRERAALCEAGVELPSPTGRARQAARAWRRPFLQTTDSLLLLCPRRAEDGGEQFPHPLWDEVEAAVEDRSRVHLLTATRLVGPERKVPRALMPLPRPRRAWRTPDPPPVLREVESPSSLADLLSCSLRWCLLHRGRVRAGPAATLPTADDPALQGQVVHQVLAEVLRTRPRSPMAAADLAETVFERVLAETATPFLLPGAGAPRARARAMARRAARAFVQLLDTSGRRVAHIEERLAGNIDELEIEGSPDLVLEPDGAIVDWKRSGSRYRRDELRASGSLQLVTYAFLESRGREGTLPPVAYFVLDEASLLTTHRQAFPGAEHVPGPLPPQVWSAIRATLADAREALAAGHLQSPGVPGTLDDPVPPDTPRIEEGRFLAAPGCRFCDLGLLCGRDLEDA